MILLQHLYFGQQVAWERFKRKLISKFGTQGLPDTIINNTNGNGADQIDFYDPPSDTSGKHYKIEMKTPPTWVKITSSFLLPGPGLTAIGYYTFVLKIENINAPTNGGSVVDNWEFLGFTEVGTFQSASGSDSLLPLSQRSSFNDVIEMMRNNGISEDTIAEFEEKVNNGIVFSISWDAYSFNDNGTEYKLETFESLQRCIIH